MKQKLLHIIFLLSVPLIVIFQFGQANFLHYHVNEFGEVVSHSHPYQIQGEDEGSPSPGHNHSSSELLQLQLFGGSMSFELSSFSTCVLYITQLFVSPSIDWLYAYDTYKIEAYTLRGPPIKA